MLELLNFFADDAANAGNNNNTGWIMWVILGVLLVGMVLMMVIPNRRQRKRAEEMMAKLAVGSLVTTIGGIVGVVVQMDESNIWIETGLEESKTTMKFLRQAIHSIAPAPGSPEAIAEEKAEQKAANEQDEIK